MTWGRIWAPLHDHFSGLRLDLDKWMIVGRDDLGTLTHWQEVPNSNWALMHEGISERVGFLRKRDPFLEQFGIVTSIESCGMLQLAL